MVERHVMSHPARVALLAVAIVALIRPVAQVLEYGAEGWLWALFGLSHRLALEQGTARAVLTRNLLAGLAAGVYAVTEVADHGLGAAPALVLVGLLAALAAALVRFRRAELTGQPPRPLAALARFCGRRSLEIYAISLLVMQISAYAVETSEDDEDE
jgi:peptidoglycan/LPS O-acetylase OafA/YrhL